MLNFAFVDGRSISSFLYGKQKKRNIFFYDFGVQGVVSYFCNSSKQIGIFFMLNIGKICLGSFCFKLGIDEKGLAGLGLVKLLWNKKGYYENESLGLT